jgi:hypothetical protein
MGPGSRFARPGRQLKSELAARCAVSSHLQPYKDTVMVIGIAHLQPIVALVAGILILVMPRLLNFIVAIYLILVGVMGLGLIK